MSVSVRASRSGRAALGQLILRASTVIDAACFACLTAGAVVGLLGRLAMLLLTLAGGTSGSFVLLRFTLAGILRILVEPMVLGFPFALLLAGLWPGLLLLTDSSFKLSAVNRTVGVALFAALYFAFGFLVGLAVDYWNRIATRRGWHAKRGPVLWRWLLWAVVFAGLVVVGVWSHGETFG
jgi:hypothetical protein